MPATATHGGAAYGSVGVCFHGVAKVLICGVIGQLVVICGRGVGQYGGSWREVFWNSLPK
jgi:hypothetical protein